jgi:hypothetical protein
MITRFMALATIGLAAMAGAQTPPPAPAPDNSPAGIVDAQIAAYNAGDVQAFAAFYAENVEFYDLGPPGAPTMQGRAALIRQYQPIFARHHPRARVTNRIVDGDYVIDREVIVAGEHSNSGAAIYQVEDGKIRRVWFTPAVLRLRPK